MKPKWIQIAEYYLDRFDYFYTISEDVIWYGNAFMSKGRDEYGEFFTIGNEYFSFNYHENQEYTLLKVLRKFIEGIILSKYHKDNQTLDKLIP